MSLQSSYDDSKAAIRVVAAGGSFGNSGNVTLAPSPNYIGLATTSEALKLAGEDLTNDVMKVEQRMSYQALMSLVTVNIKSGSGFLHSIVVGGQSLPTLNIWDNTTAATTLIGTINGASATGTYVYNVAFTTGLTVQPLPGTAVLPCFTISYR